MKKGWKIFWWTVLCVLIALVVTVMAIWGREIRTLATVKSVAGNEYLYTMQYRAGYDLDDVIKKDVDTNPELLEYVISRVGKGLPIQMKSSQVADENGEMDVFNCTSFQALKADGEGFWYGRNYDYFKNPTMVTFSHPKKGYASIGVSDMSHFGYSLEKLPTKFLSRLNCLAAIYAPVDGINEKGLCTSIMALPKQASQQDTERHDVGTTIIMRLWLDRCATVSEALELLETVDVRHDASVGAGYHYMVADANGDCAIVEFDKEDGWKTMILRKDPEQNAMLVTNHLLSPKYRTDEPDIAVGNPNSKSWWRYETAKAYLDSLGGCLTFPQVQECLALVHWKDLPIPGGKVEDTQYSNVYDQQNLTLALRNWNDYETTHRFELK
ncbi:MAG: linear amide C-N hydrolase [Bacteroidales bacterium]|nr:linear amide C-N hydrolase [Bacteroidales bacterium]